MSLLNCLCAAIPARERVITCEEVQVPYTGCARGRGLPGLTALTQADLLPGPRGRL
jgi:hypothetical protein